MPYTLCRRLMADMLGPLNPLSPYFSEFGLITYRVRVEVEYFIALAELPLPALSGSTTSTNRL